MLSYQRRRARSLMRERPQRRHCTKRRRTWWQDAKIFCRTWSTCAIRRLPVSVRSSQFLSAYVLPSCRFSTTCKISPRAAFHCARNAEEAHSPSNCWAYLHYIDISCFVQDFPELCTHCFHYSSQLYSSPSDLGCLRIIWSLPWTNTCRYFVQGRRALTNDGDLVATLTTVTRVSTKASSCGTV